MRKKCFIMLLCSLLFVSAVTLYNVGSDIYAGERKKGDLNNDGLITLFDANKVLKIALGIDVPNEDEKNASDLYENGNITLENANLVLQIALGIIKDSDLIPVQTSEPTVTPFPTIEPNFEEKTVYADIYTDVVKYFMRHETQYESGIGLKKSTFKNATENDFAVIEYNLKQLYPEMIIFWEFSEGYDEYAQLLEMTGDGYGHYIEIDYINIREDGWVDLKVFHQYGEYYGGVYECIMEQNEDGWDMTSIDCILNI